MCRISSELAFLPFSRTSPFTPAAPRRHSSRYILTIMLCMQMTALLFLQEPIRQNTSVPSCSIPRRMKAGAERMTRAASQCRVAASATCVALPPREDVYERRLARARGPEHGADARRRLARSRSPFPRLLLWPLRRRLCCCAACDARDSLPIQTFHTLSLKFGTRLFCLRPDLAISALVLRSAVYNSHPYPPLQLG